MLGITDNDVDAEREERRKKSDIPFPTEHFEVRDTYVIDITPKDPKYPQSRKRIWMDKQMGQPFYAVVWDQSGKIWKVWSVAYTRYETGDNEFAAYRSQFGVDVQYGAASWYEAILKPNICEYDYLKVSLAAFLNKAR